MQPGVEAEEVTIAVAESAADIAAAAELFREYAALLGFSLCFQNFDAEVATLPGKYASPSGRLLLARCGGSLAGCGGLRPLEGAVCEMKRLFVRPGFRGRRIGCLLTERLIEEAKAIGYEFIRLDTVPSRMPEAARLYRSLGFYEIQPYCHNPQPDVSYMELRLR